MYMTKQDDILWKSLMEITVSKVQDKGTALDKWVSDKFLLFLHKNICCGYSLEVPHQSTSNEYSQAFLYGHSI